LFEKSFIFDSYANRRGKGTFKAILRYDYFARKVTHNYSCKAYVLKADIQHYFDEVNHSILLSLILTKIKDPKVLWLIKVILNNYSITARTGIPLGNLTSQFFANIYLHELDVFVKTKIRAKYYLRYVDDFVLFHPSPLVLEKWKEEIVNFIRKELMLKLHPNKSKILPLHIGIDFLGLKIFPHHRLLKRKNIRSFHRKFQQIHVLYTTKTITYDSIYNFIEGWCANSKKANVFKCRTRILSRFEEKYKHDISTKEVNRGLHYYQILKNKNIEK